jgi:hypothetical protein
LTKQKAKGILSAEEEFSRLMQKRLRGLKDSEMDHAVRSISYDALVDLMIEDSKVAGRF